MLGPLDLTYPGTVDGGDAFLEWVASGLDSWESQNSGGGRGETVSNIVSYELDSMLRILRQ